MFRHIRVAMLILCLGMLALISAAQDTFVSADGKVSFTVPAGWHVAEQETTIIVSNTLEGIDIGRRGDSALPGTIVVLMTAASNIPQIGNNGQIAPAELVNTFLTMTGMQGEVVEFMINGFDVAQAEVETPDTRMAKTQAAIAAIASPNGTVFMIMETGDAVDTYSDGLLVIADSITKAAAAPAPAPAGSQLTYNSSTTGALTDSVTEQLFTFSGTKGDTVTITMIADNMENLDTFVWLLTSEGFAGDDLVPLVDNDDAADASLGRYNSQIKDYVLPETGEYTIRATRISGVGGFTLILESPNAPAAAPAAAAEIRQWASAATASSQYGTTRWSASQATGEPNASESCSDNGNAWASQKTGTKENITLSFDQAVVPAEIHIYQVYNPGSIVRVEVANSASGERLTLPNSADPVGNTPCPGVFTVAVSDVSLAVDTVTIYIDQASVRSWTEIDAVELVGRDPNAAAPAVTAAADPVAVLGADAKSWELASGIAVPYPADFMELSLATTYFVVADADFTTFFNHFSKTPFPIEQKGPAAVDTIISMFYSDFPFEPTDVIDVLGDGSILLGFAKTNSNAQVAFYVYEKGGETHFLQVEAVTDSTNKDLFPISDEMLAIGLAMVQVILADG